MRFLLAPLLVVLVLSFSAGTYLSFLPPGWAFGWYAALIDNVELRRAARNSAVLALIVTSVSLAVGIPAALAVKRSLAPRVVITMLSFPLLLPTLVIGLGLTMVLQPLGLLATWPGLALGHPAVVLPLTVRLTAASFAARFPISRRPRRHWAQTACAASFMSPCRSPPRVSWPPRHCRTC